MSGFLSETPSSPEAIRAPLDFASACRRPSASDSWGTILALAAALGVGMLLGLDLGAFLGSLPRWAGATTTTSASVTVAALLSGLARDV